MFRLSTGCRARAMAPVLWLLAGLGPTAAEQLPVRVYDIHDGLAGDSITRILQDSRGYLWFATADGMSRFDGERFWSYGIQDGLPHSRVHTLLETGDGAYWAGTHGGLARYDPERAPAAGPAFAPVLLASRGPVHSLYEDRAGRLWVGGDGNLAVLDRRVRAAAARPVGLGALGPSPGRVAALAETQDGSLWVGTEQGLLRLLPDGRSVPYPVLPHHGSDRVRDLAMDSAGRLWVAHAFGVVVLWPEPADSLGEGQGTPLVERARRMETLLHTETEAAPLPRFPGEVWALVPEATTGWYAIHVARDYRVWLATSRGLKAWNGERLMSWGVENGLSENAVTAIAGDKDGNLWVGTQSRGALRVAQSGFASFTVADGLAGAPVLSLFEGRDGALHVQSGDTFEGEIFLQRFQAERFTALSPRMPAGPVYLGWGQQQTALQDRSGQWWVATGQGLMRYPASAGFEDLATTPPRIFTRRDGLAADLVLRLYEDRHGDLWVGTVRGLSRWQPATDTFRSYGPGDGLPADEPSAFAEDRAGQLWIGFASAGLVRRRGERFERFGTAQGVPKGVIQSLYVDRGGRLWLALRDGGVARVDGPAAAAPKFTRYTTRQGLASDDVRCITEDAWGRLYLGGRKGIDRLDPARNRIDHFTGADGLVSNVIDVALRDRDGTLWFGSRRGLSRLVPQRQPPRPAPEALITAVHVDGVPRPVSKLGVPLVPGLELDSDRRRLEIGFLALSFAPGEVLRYQHMLEGVDEDWSAPAPARSVQYAHPPTGRLRFLVRAVTRDGLVSETPAELSLVVYPPLWRRNWVLALAVAALAAAAAGLYRYRVAHLLEIERMRTGIATDLHDDLGSSLSRISILSEVARRRVETDTESVRLLQEIGESAREMIGALNENIWAIDPRRDNLRSLTTHLRRFAGDLLEGRGIAWQLRAPQDGELVKLSPVERRQLFLIAKEALHNAARHSGAGSVAIDMALAGRGLTLEIRDDGRGFQPGAPGDGRDGRNGLRSMQARAATLGARLEIDSGPGRGTRLFLDAPIAT